MPSAARGIAVASLLLVHAAWAAGPGEGPAVAQPPAAVVDTAAVEPSGRAIAVPSGGDLQAALDSARPGDVVTLEPGAVYRGPFALPKKSGSGWIVVRTGGDARAATALPRIDPGQAPKLAKLVAASGSVVKTAPGAHHYRLSGLEIRPTEGAFVHNLIEIGSAETSTEDLPHHVIVERCLLRGDPRRGARRGVALNGAHAAVIDSYIADIKEVGADSQAIAGWNGPGPLKIANNYLEGAGENVMFGGADPSIRDLVPSDIEILRNHMAKPLAWKADAPSYTGTPWTVKNLFELKNARRVRVEGNLFEHSWVQAQIGFAIVLTVRNQDGRAPWSVVEDVTFANNVTRGATSGVNIHGRDNNHPSQPTRRIAIRNNLFADIGGPHWGGEGRLFRIVDGTSSVVIDLKEPSLAAPVRAADVGEQVVPDRDAPRRLARVVVVAAVDVDAGGRAPGHVVGEGHVLDDRPRRAPVLIAHGQDDREADLRLDPAVLEEIAFDAHAAGVLQLEEVLDGPRGARVRGRVRLPGQGLGHVVAEDLDVRGHEIADRRIDAAEHDVLAGALEVVVGDLERAGPVPARDGLGVSAHFLDVRDVGIDHRSVPAVERDAAAGPSARVAAKEAALDDHVVWQVFGRRLGGSDLDQVVDEGALGRPDLQAAEAIVLGAGRGLHDRSRRRHELGKLRGLAGIDPGQGRGRPRVAAGPHHDPARSRLFRQGERPSIDGAGLEGDDVPRSGAIERRLQVAAARHGDGAT